MAEVDKDKYYKEMLRAVCLSEWNEEEGHMLADKVLCDLLRELGYDDIVNNFELNVHKWYC